METKNMLITVSGGRSSGMAAYHIHNSKKYAGYNKVYAFCNVGQEKPKTIQFLKDMVKHWGLPLVLLEGKYSTEPGIGVRHTIVNDFDSLDMSSNVFKNAIRHMNKNKWTGVPNQAIPYCSEYMKKRVSHSFAREIFQGEKYITSLGYRFEDTPRRISFAELREDKTRIAPLLTDFVSPMTKYDVTRFYDGQPFKLGIPSKFGNCELCHKASDKNLIERIQYGVSPETIEFYRWGEAEYGNMFFRGNKSIDDLIALAASGTQLSMFDDNGDNMCVCNF